MKASRGEVKAYIILVNWRNPFDTIECVQSLMRLTYHNFQVVVCDNGSTDDSNGIFRHGPSVEFHLCPKPRIRPDFWHPRRARAWTHRQRLSMPKM